MKDALGTVQSILVLGGSSDIAIATAKKLAGPRKARVVLAGRTPAKLDARAEELKGFASSVETVEFDALNFQSHEKFVNDTFDKFGSFDVVLVAFGVLGNQEQDAKDPQAAVEVVEANYTGAVSSLLYVSKKLQQQGSGTIVVLSSVAGIRARKANFIYGSSKAGLDAFCQGLGDSLAGTGVKVIVVRPGFVKSAMTAHMKTGPMATTPEAVADSVDTAVRRGTEIVYSPAKLRPVFIVIKNLPRVIFRRMPA